MTDAIQVTLVEYAVMAEWSGWLVEKASLKANGRGSCLFKGRFPVACCSTEFQSVTDVSTAALRCWMIAGYLQLPTASPRLTSGPLSLSLSHFYHETHCMKARHVLRPFSLFEWVSECVCRVWRPTQHIIGHFGDDFTGQMTKPTLSKHWRKPVGRQRPGLNPTRTTPPCYNNTTRQPPLRTSKCDKPNLFDL